jgi:phospholipid/cholesterol/gamma-HCH transport system substrate-binding protein
VSARTTDDAETVAVTIAFKMLTSLSNLGDVAVNVINASRDSLVTNLRNLQPILTELAKAGNEIPRSLQILSSLVSTATENLPQTINLIHSGGTVLDTQNDLAPQTLNFTSEFASFAGQLRKSDADLRGLLDKGVPASSQVTDLIHQLDVPLSTLLNNGIALGQVAQQRLAPLRMELILYPYIIATSFGVFRDGYTRFGVPFPFTTQPSVCTQGYDTSYDRVPTEYTTTNGFPYGLTCKLPTNANQLVRGARTAPLANGTKIGDTPSYANDQRVP